MSDLSFGVRLTLFVILVAVSTAWTIAGVAKAVRALRSGRPYVFGWWDGGAFLAGRRVHPASGLGGAILTGAVVVVLLWGLVTGRWPKPDLVFEIPTGWLDLSRGAPPTNLLRLPREKWESFRRLSDETKRLAVDIEHPGSDGQYPQFTAGYMHANRELDDAAVRDIVARSAEGESAEGLRLVRTEYRTIETTRLARAVVDCGDIESPRLFIYVFERGSTFALLSCGGPASEIARLEPICDATAERTVRRNPP